MEKIQITLKRSFIGKKDGQIATAKEPWHIKPKKYHKRMYQCILQHEDCRRSCKTSWYIGRRIRLLRRA